MGKKAIGAVLIVIILFSVSTICYPFWSDMRKSQRAYESFRQFTGQKNGISITFIEDEYNSGVDAIGVVEKYIRPYVVYLEYYYRETGTISWNHFYRRKVNMDYLKK